MLVYQQLKILFQGGLTMTNYNKTQLHPDTTLERFVFHRDQFGHVLRWFYVAKLGPSMRENVRILDYGCGSGNLAKLLYHNRWAPKEYLGLDVRKQTIDKLNETWKDKQWCNFKCEDLCRPFPMLDSNSNLIDNGWDIISCFEVIEHIGHANAPQFLENMRLLANKDTVILLSTPNYDDKVGPADNHIIDGEIGEWKHEELQSLLEQYFLIEKKIGTFASMKDYKDFIYKHEWKGKMFDELHQFYDSNMMSIIMAPLVPAELARNCIWVLKVK